MGRAKVMDIVHKFLNRDVEQALQSSKRGGVECQEQLKKSVKEAELALEAVVERCFFEATPPKKEIKRARIKMKLVRMAVRPYFIRMRS